MSLSSLSRVLFCLCVGAAVAAGEPGAVVTRINFQPAGAAVPSGYAPDSGAPFTAARGYGWDRALDSRERDSDPDQRLDTQVFVRNSDPVATWECELPDGAYYVTLVAGSALSTGRHSVDLEGTRVLDGVQTGDGEYVEVTDHRVTVSDGRLTMTAGAGGGSQKTKLCYLEIRADAGAATPPADAPPAVAASASVTSGEAPLDVAFAADASDDGSSLSYAWEFGDGATSTAANPVHTYAGAGTFTARVTVTDDGGQTAADTVTITVAEPASPPATPPPATGGVVARVNFQPAGSPVPEGHVADDGSPFSDALGRGWSRRLDARDEASHDDQRLDTYVFVYNDESAAEWEYALPEGDYRVTLVAGSPHWSGIHHVWLEGAKVIDGATTGPGEFVEVADRAVTVADGRLTVRLGGTGTKKTKLCYLEVRGASAKGTPPQVSVQAVPAQGTAPLAVSFTADVTDDGPIASHAWDFGDGGTADAEDASHTYTAAGTYAARLTVVDADGNVAQASVTVSVAAPPSGGGDGGNAGDVVTTINFQPGASTAPAGALVDSGATYSTTRGYGWSTSVETLDSGANADPRLATYAFVRNDEGVREWNYDLPSGEYVVTLVAGSPAWSGRHTVELEGEVVLDDVATTQGFAEVKDRPVLVTDGRLTVRIGGSGNSKKTKLCYVEIHAPGDAGAPYGLTGRQVVTGLTFPTAPNPVSLTAVKAFPSLAFEYPTCLAAPDDDTDRVFVGERAGRVRVFANDAAAAATAVFLDLTAQVSRDDTEEGLLGLAFDPAYATNGYVYVCYSYSAETPRRTRVSRFRVKADDANAADPATETILLEIPQTGVKHNGGCLAFGPDGKLYVSAGDSGSASQAQDLQSLLGKILRIEPDGSVPADNPFTGGVGRGEIWALGFRNPWRLGFDRQDGTLWVADVGENRNEEVDVVVKGGNYGWPMFEGDEEYSNPAHQPASGFDAPVATYSHSMGSAIIGGTVYRGPSLTSVQGAYLYADYASGRVWAYVPSENASTYVGDLDRIASFGEDAAGELYACSFDGSIYRFEEAQDAGEPPPFPTKLSETGLFTDVVNLVPAPGVIEYAVKAPLWSDGAVKRRWIALPGSERIAFDATEAWTFPVGTVMVKHFEMALPGGETTRLETRVLLHTTTGWEGYTYRWNFLENDADLLGGRETEVLTVPSAGGGSEELVWTYPSPDDCRTCHTAAAGRVLGVRTRQLNGDFDYAGVADNQLRAWNHIGLFTTDIGAPDQYEALVDPADATAPLPARARSYLAVNCAQCHRPTGPTPINMDLRYGTPLDGMNAVGVAPTTGLSTVAGAQRIRAGMPEQSVVWELMGRLGDGRMPPLGSARVDIDGRKVIEDWIRDGPE